MKRRLDKLEGSLGPKEVVLHWLAEAHAAGSLPAYVASLTGGPDSAQPFIALPRTVADGVWHRMRGEPKVAIRTAMDEAIVDTVFLLRPGVGLNVHVDEVRRVESLRHAALYWWSRALDGGAAAEAPPEWQGGAAALAGTIKGTEDALRATERRYLDGHDCLFPDLMAAWRELLVAAEPIAGAARHGEHRLLLEWASRRMRRVVAREATR